MQARAHWKWPVRASNPRGECDAYYRLAAQMVVTPEQFDTMHQLLVSLFSDEQRSVNTFESLTALATLFSRLPSTVIPDILHQAIADLRSDAGEKVWNVAAEELRALAPRLDATQADAAMRALLQRHASWYLPGRERHHHRVERATRRGAAHEWLQQLLPQVERDEKELIGRAAIIVALAARAAPADVPAAFAAGVRAMEIEERRGSLDKALEPLAARMPAEARGRAVEQAKALAGWSRFDDARQTAATLLVRLWSSEPTDRFVQQLTEVYQLSNDSGPASGGPRTFLSPARRDDSPRCAERAHS